MNSEVATKYFKNLAPAPAPPPPPIRITSFEEDMLKHQSETGWQGEPAVEVYQADMAGTKEEAPKKEGFHASARKRSASDLGTSASSTSSNGSEDYTSTVTATTPRAATITIITTEATTTPTQHNNSTLGFLGRATAVFDFIAENYGEINFVAGDILCVYGKYDDWWYGYVEGKGGPHGYFPAVYVEEQ